jgi:glycosyltransferase involved in cell wall biosynthesis
MISVTILTKDSEKYIEEVLQALQSFQEVAILDTGSKDRTIDIVTKFPNVVLFQRPFTGFGPCHNLVSSLAKGDWILSIDSDEIASQELVDQILRLELNPQAIYSIPRRNYYRGKVIKGCGWYPDRALRLYNKTITQFSNALVHESVNRHNLTIIPLREPLHHFPYATTADFLAKMELYATLFAEQHQGRKRSSTLIAVCHGLFAFVKSYFLKRGLLLGGQGLEISAYNGVLSFYKYLNLRDSNNQAAARRSVSAEAGAKSMHFGSALPAHGGGFGVRGRH